MRLHVFRAQCTLFIDVITSNEPIPHRPTHTNIRRSPGTLRVIMMSYVHAHTPAVHTLPAHANHVHEERTSAKLQPSYFKHFTLPPYQPARGISLPQHSQASSKSCLLLTLSTCSLTHGTGNASSKWPGWHTQCVASSTDDKLLFARARAQGPSYVECAQQSIATSAKVNWDLCTVRQ